MESLLWITVFTHLGTLTAGWRFQWGYTGDNGPSHWHAFVRECNGKRQSPINIDTDSVEVEHWQPFIFDNYDVPANRMELTNSGHTAKITMEHTVSPRVHQGGLNGDYTFSLLHFHWGSDSGHGSEHTINNVRYPLEMQIVSYKYGSIAEAISKPDGMAVLSVMFEVGETDNAVFTPIVEALDDVTESGMKVYLDQPLSPLRAFLPDDTEKFYRYEGSLTTPTCNEAVVWTVFDEPVKISEKQLNAFRRLKTEDGQWIVNNYRPTQPLHRRKVLMRSGTIPKSSNSMEMMILAMFFLATAAVAVIVKIL